MILIFSKKYEAWSSVVNKEKRNAGSWKEEENSRDKIEMRGKKKERE